MITKWKVFNFKSVRKETELRFAPLTIFAGANSSGNPGCTVTTCSCTNTFATWSSSTVEATPLYAWSTFFFLGGVNFDHKSLTVDVVRAVRDA